MLSSMESFKNIIRKLACFGLYIAVLSSFYLIASYIKQEYTAGVYATKALVGRNKSICKALFSPDDPVSDIFIDLIDAEKKEILIAIFTLTDKSIAQALIDARKRGVLVEIVADQGYLRPESYSKIDFLAASGIPIFTFDTYPCKQRGYCLMHHKFAIFGKNILNKSILWMGSFNLTNSAKTNQESVIVEDNQDLLDAFKKQFLILKKRCKMIKVTPYRQEISEKPEVAQEAEESWWNRFAGKFL